MGTLGWSEPTRFRRSVHRAERHLGYVTTVAYPNRDITALSEGSPFSEIVIADPRERHVVLLQRYEAHWLVQCGNSYDTTERGGELNDDQSMGLALFALERNTTGAALAAEMVAEIERLFELRFGRPSISAEGP